MAGSKTWTEALRQASLSGLVSATDAEIMDMDDIMPRPTFTVSGAALSPEQERKWTLHEQALEAYKEATSPVERARILAMNPDLEADLFCPDCGAEY